MRKTIKRLILALAGLTICSVMPALALTGDLAGDSNALDRLNVLSMKFEDAYEKRDAAAIGALFAEDAVCLTPEGLFCGRKAIEKACADDFRRWLTASQIHEADQLNAVGSGAWSIGQWWRTLQAPEGLKFARGYWSALFVLEGDGWKIRMMTFNETSPRIEPARTE